jgi:PAS domain S-box-containing protein
MTEVARIRLENEMDLILAHKRTMKLCELTGFTLVAQTLIATAVSEIARCAIDYGTNASLILGIESQSGGRKFVQAVIADTVDFTGKCAEAYSYAKRLVSMVETTKEKGETKISLRQQVSFAGTITDAKIESFVEFFKSEQPLSAYDELRRNNAMLREFAERLKESENEYRMLTDSLPLMMFSVNNHGIITYSNKWVHDFLGNIPKELESKGWANFIHEQDFPRYTKDISTAIQQQRPLSGRYRFRNKSNGNFFWHLLSVNPLKNDSGAVTRWFGFIADINAEIQMQRTKKENQSLTD